MSYNFAVVNNNSKPSYNPGNSKSISVSSDVTINNNLQITENSIATTNPLEINAGGLTVNNGATVNSGLTVNNGATVNSGLTVNDGTTLNGILNVNSNTLQVRGIQLGFYGNSTVNRPNVDFSSGTTEDHVNRLRDALVTLGLITSS